MKIIDLDGQNSFNAKFKKIDCSNQSKNFEILFIEKVEQAKSLLIHS